MRVATASDGPEIVRLAALDSAPAPSGPIVVAEVDGQLAAALAVDTGRAIADPFRRTAALVAMLELRAADIARARAAGATVTPFPRRAARLARFAG